MIHKFSFVGDIITDPFIVKCIDKLALKSYLIIEVRSQNYYLCVGAEHILK